MYPLQLVWTPAKMRMPYRIVAETATCDLGFLDQDADHFILATPLTPSGFPGDVHNGQAIRIKVGVAAQNALRGKPLILEIAWDGGWTDNPVEMERHLVIGRAEALTP